MAGMMKPGLGAALMKGSPPTPDDMPAEGGAEDDAELEVVADDLLAAIKRNDRKAVAAALRASHAVCGNEE